MEYDFRPKVAILVIALLLIGVFAAPAALADELYGRVRGVVTDASGAVLPGVQVKLTNVGTGAMEEKTSESDGSFTFINLQPGSYSLVASKASFKTFQARGIAVSPNQIFVQNVHMELGMVSETLEVLANPAQVEQSSMQLTATINDKAIVDLPLNGRNWVTLQQSLPGVVLPDTRFSTNYSTNGSQAQQNSFLINGSDSNDLPLNSPLAPPNPDAIAEVKMVTNTINPEFGRNSGAIMNAVTKSGTNSFHGSAFEFYRDTFLNTRNFFQLTPSVFHQNQFGGTIGGPILKNKTFFFFSFQGTRNRIPSTNGGATPGTTTVFTQAQLNGQWDPTALLPNPIPAGLNIVGPGGPCAAGTAWDACFTGGVVPTSNYGALPTQLVQQFVPLPNLGTDQFSFQPIVTGVTNQWLGRLDQNIGSKDTIWFYGYANNQATVDDLPFTGSTLPGFGQQSKPWTKQFTAAWNHTLTPEILNELRVGYTRLNFKAVQPASVVQPGDVGFPNIIPQITSGAGYPTMAITGYFTLGFSTNGPQPRIDQTYQINDNFSWVKGRHSLKFGYDGRKFQVWNPFGARNSGSFTFDNSGAFSTGDPGLDFLLGIPATYNQQSGAIIIADAYEHYLYAQDQWRVRDNLTITLGTGYQIDTPIAEYQNGGLSRVCFQPGVQSTAFPDAPVGYTFPGDGACNKYGGAKTQYRHFGPRVGFAYSPSWGGTGKTSIRGGFGVYFNRSEEEGNLQDLGVAPFGQSTNGAAHPSFPNPFVDIDTGATTTNPFPYTPPAPGTTGIDFTQFFPAGVTSMIFSVVDPKLTTPYAMNYNLTIERELPARTILRLAYVGSQGRKLFTSYSFNSTTPAGVQACLTDPNNGSGTGCADDPLDQPIFFPDHYPFPGNIFGNSGIQRNGGWSNYNSFQVTADKRFSHGLQFQTSYTWAHALDTGSSFEDVAFQTAGSFDPYGRLRRDYGGSAFDARHRWVLSFSYDIPSLHKVWAAVPSRLVEGWKITGINALQSGFPINFQDVSANSLTCSWAFSFYACPDRPDVVFRPTALDPRTAVIGTKNHYWFDPSAFQPAALGTLGTTPRGFFYGPGYWNTDFSVQKETKITEGTSVQLRLEAFNLFNHTNFANPSGSVTSGNFGRSLGIRNFTNSRLVQLGAKFIF